LQLPPPVARAVGDRVHRHAPAPTCATAVHRTATAGAAGLRGAAVCGDCAAEHGYGGGAHVNRAPSPASAVDGPVPAYALAAVVRLAHQPVCGQRARQRKSARLNVQEAAAAPAAILEEPAPALRAAPAARAPRRWTEAGAVLLAVAGAAAQRPAAGVAPTAAGGRRNGRARASGKATTVSSYDTSDG
jgi:hypothetical protein